MSSKQCDIGGGTTTGFPINITPSISALLSKSYDTSNNQIQNLIVPTEFTVDWGTSSTDAQITVTQTSASGNNPAICRISGLDSITAGASITYGNARYSCSNVLSIVANQHSKLNLISGKQAQYEVILAFQINNKRDNPSSPDIILLTRPIVLTEAGDPAAANTPVFWSSVNALMSQLSSTISSKSQKIQLDMTKMFGYNSNTLMPMLSYQTCLPVKVINSLSNPAFFIGSLTMRVNIVINPIYIAATATEGLQKCLAVTKYTLVTKGGGPLDIFTSNSFQFNTGANTFIQFKDGFGSDGFPESGTVNNLVLSTSTSVTTTEELMKKIEIVVPDSLLGKSITDVSAASTLPVTAKPLNTRFKCYSIDPTSDIKNGQIMIDPTTGKTLTDTLQQQSSAASGFININAPTPGILPGDVEEGLVITVIVIFSIILSGYASFIIYNFLYQGIPPSSIWFHCFIFGLILFCLIGFSAYTKSKTS
jgi:hypothetical protein